MAPFETKEVIAFCGFTMGSLVYGGLARLSLREWLGGAVERRRPQILFTVAASCLIYTLSMLLLFSITRVESWRTWVPIHHAALAPLLFLSPLSLMLVPLGLLVMALRYRGSSVEWLRTRGVTMLAFLVLAGAAIAVLDPPMRTGLSEVRNLPLRVLMQVALLAAITWVAWAGQALLAARLAGYARPRRVKDAVAAPDCLPVRDRGGVLLLKVHEITSIQIDRGLVYVTTAAGRFWTKHTTLSELGPLLGAETFLRVHRRSVVNVACVRGVTLRDNHTARLKLSCGSEVDVSRSRMRFVRARLSL